MVLGLHLFILVLCTGLVPSKHSIFGIRWVLWMRWIYERRWVLGMPSLLSSKPWAYSFVYLTRQAHTSLWKTDLFFIALIPRACFCALWTLSTTWMKDFCWSASGIAESIPSPTYRCFHRRLSRWSCTLDQSMRLLAPIQAVPFF